MHRLANAITVVAMALIPGGGLAFAAEPTAAQSSFVNSAAQAGMMEVEAAKVALATSGTAAVKEYAYRVISDYERMQADLAGIAGKRSIAFPAELDTERARMLQSLRDTPPPAFDAAYFTYVVLDQGRTVQLLQDNLLNPDVELAIFSSYNLPRISGHRRVAEELQATLAK